MARRARGASTACSSIPKSRTRRRARSSWSASCARSAAARRCWSAGNIIEDAIERVRAQVGSGKVLLGPLRRRRLLGRCRAAASGDRRSARLRVRRSRPAAPRRRRPGHEHVRASTSACGSSASTPKRASSRRSPASTDPEAKRKIIGRTVRRSVRRRGPQAHRRRASSRRARSIPTSSSPRARAPARRTSSSPITTSAACPRR